MTAEPAPHHDRRRCNDRAKEWTAHYNYLLKKFFYEHASARKRRAALRQMPNQKLDTSDQKLIAQRAKLIEKTLEGCLQAEPQVSEKLSFGIGFLALTLLRLIRQGGITEEKAQGPQKKQDSSKDIHMVPIHFQRSFFVAFWSEVLLDIINRKESPLWKQFMQVLKVHIFGIERCAGAEPMSFDLLLDRIRDNYHADGTLRSCEISSLISMNAPSDEMRSEFQRSHHNTENFGHLVVRTNDRTFRILFALLKTLKRKEGDMSALKLLFVFFEAELVARYTKTNILSEETQQNVMIRSRLALLHRTLLQSMLTFGPPRPPTALHTAVLEQVKSIGFIDQAFWKRNIKSRRGMHFCKTLSAAEVQVCVMAVAEHRVTREEIWYIAIALLSHHTKPEFLRSFLDRTLAPILRSYTDCGDESTTLAAELPQTVLKCLAAVLLLNILHPNRGIRDASYDALRCLCMAYAGESTPDESEHRARLFEFIGARILSSRFGAALLERVLFDASIDKTDVFPSSAMLLSLKEDTWRQIVWKAILRNDFCALNYLAQHGEWTLDGAILGGHHAPPVDICTVLFSPDVRLRIFYAERALLFLESYAHKAVLKDQSRLQDRAHGEPHLALTSGTHPHQELDRMLASRFGSEINADELVRGISQSFVFLCVTREDCRSLLKTFLDDQVSEAVDEICEEPIAGQIKGCVIQILLQSYQALAEKFPCDAFISLLMKVSFEVDSQYDTIGEPEQATTSLSRVNAFGALWPVMIRARKPSRDLVDQVGHHIMMQLAPCVRGAVHSSAVEKTFANLHTASHEPKLSPDEVHRRSFVIWLQILRLFQLAEFARSDKLLDAMRASMMLIPGMHGLLGLVFTRCVLQNGLETVNYWTKHLCANVMPVSFILAAACRGNTDIVRQYIERMGTGDSHLNASDSLDRLKVPGDREKHFTVSDVHKDLHSFGFSFAVLEPVLSEVHQATNPARFMSDETLTSVVASVDDIHSPWTQSVALAFCSSESFANSMVGIFERHLDANAQVEPFDKDRYVRGSNAISRFTCVLLAAVQAFSKSQIELQACRNEYFLGGFTQPAHSDIPVSPHSALIISATQSSGQAGDFAMQAVHRIFSALGTSIEAQGDKLSGLDRPLQYTSILSILQSSQGEDLTAKIALYMLRDETFTPAKRVPNAELPSTDVASQPHRGTDEPLVSAEFDVADQSIASATESDGIPPEALLSAVLENSSSAASSPVEPSLSARASSGSESARSSASRSLTYELGAIRQAVRPDVLNRLTAVQRRSYPRVDAVPYAPANMSTSKMQATHGQTPGSAILDLQVSPVGRDLPGPRVPPPIGVLHDSIDRSRMHHVIANQSRESAADCLRSPVDQGAFQQSARVQAVARTDRKLPAIGSLPRASFMRSFYSKMRSGSVGSE